MKGFAPFRVANGIVLLLLLLCMLHSGNRLRAQTGYTTYLLPDSAIMPADLSMVSGNGDGFTIHGELDISSTNAWRERFAFYLDSAGQLVQSRKWNITQQNGFLNSDVTKLPGGFLDAMLYWGSNGLYEDIQAVKTDANGNITWSDFYTPDTLKHFWKGPFVARLPDNSYIVTSDVNIDNLNTTTHYFIMRLDSSGNVTWANGYLDLPQKITLLNMDITKNQDILVVGSRYNTIPQAFVSDLLRVDKNGNLLWAYQYQYNQMFLGRTVHESPGDSIWMVSEIPTTSLSSGGPGLMKLDSAGQTAWGIHYSHPQYPMIPDGSIPTNDSGIVIFGVFASSPLEAFLLKLDAQGNQQWFYTIPDLTIADISERSNGNIRYVGTDFNLVPGLKYGELVPGTASACATLRPPLLDLVFTPLVIPDSLVIPIPITRTPRTLHADLAISTDSIVCNGLVGLPDDAVNNQSLSFELIPNPAGERVRISGLRGQNTIRLYNSHGQLCMNQISKNEEQWIDVTPFAEGLYFITIDNGEKRTTQKLIIQR